MIHWLIRWLTAGYCNYYAAYLILTDCDARMGAENLDLEESAYG